MNDFHFAADRVVRNTLPIASALLLFVGTAQAQVDPAVLKAEADRVAVIERARQATVAVFAASGQGGGSGVLISADGFALSNFHVTREAGEAMKCGLADGNLYDAVIVGIDPVGDVGLIKLLGRDDFPFAELADSDKVQAGDWCFASGNPFLLATDFKPTITYGLVSGVHRYQYPSGTLLEYADCIQADAAINPGNSGGPLFDSHGRVIGINGRGSFEKRGRVNVGVGYAISINQIKNFLGHLKSGRVIDHATLGARAASDEQRRVIVDDVLEDSDAARRGLQYGDEILSVGGRPVASVNALKNVLGIYPKGWRVPITFRRDDEMISTFVRLRGVHREAELATLAQGGPGRGQPRPNRPRPGGPRPDGPEPMPGDKKPSDKPPDDKRPGDKKPDPKRPLPIPLPSPGDLLRRLFERPTMPALVRKHYLAKPGFVNYYFNQLNRDRVWKALVARGDFATGGGVWRASGQLAAGGQVQLELADQAATIKLPGGEAKVALDGDLAESLDPPRSGGLLVALGLWRRLLVQTPAKFGQVEYVGAAPLPQHDGLFDVLSATAGNVECLLYFNPGDGQLALVEMFPEQDTDPCEIYMSDYREVQGRMLPHRLEVRHGDAVYHVMQLDRFEVSAAEK